jgi:hypothetical protein
MTELVLHSVAQASTETTHPTHKPQQMPREEQKHDARTSQEVESGGKNDAARKKKQKKKKKKHGAVQQQQMKQNDANIGNEGSNNDTEMQDVEVSPQ